MWKNKVLDSVKSKGQGMLRDPAVYPLIALVSTALVGATSFGIYYSINSPDVRVSKTERGELMRRYNSQNKDVRHFDKPWDNVA